MDLENFISKYNNCVEQLDENKVCENCIYKNKTQEESPCNECYSFILGLPVNPTKFEKENLK